MTRSSSPRAPIALAAVLTGLLGACNANRAATTGSIYPADYRTRHPIVLADAGRSLDVFPTGTGHLDPRQAVDVDAFMLEFRRYGRGTLVIDLPRGVAPALGAAAERTGAAIRRIGAESGVPAQAIVLSGYGVANPSLAAPIRLSFQRMQAKVADQCGLWPNDLGTSNPAFDLSNNPSWNLGCASQATLAAQVADPIDLVRGRPEGRIDTVGRVKNINDLRDGKDPSTTWRQDGKGGVKEDVGK
jgi:pilus assembly protein CpaD